MVVCLGHLRNAILASFPDLNSPGVVIKAFYAVTGLGHQAVMVFFVLSGYFVGGGVLRAGTRFLWGNYLVSRLSRLWMVLIPALLITWGIGKVLDIYAPAVLLGANYDLWHSGPKPGEYSDSLGTFLANVLFLQTITSPVFGTNGPLWSLANEFWYYMMFPLLAIVMGRVGAAGYFSRAIAFAIMLAIAWWLPREILDGFMIWMMGVAVYVLQPRMQSLDAITARMASLVALVLFVLSLGYSKSDAWMRTLSVEPDFVVGMAFSLLCLSLTYRPFPEMRWPRIAHLSRALSEISYSFYLSHFPIVILIASLVYDSRKLNPDGMAMAQFFGWVIVLLGFGALLWRLCESRTPWARSKLTVFVNTVWSRS